MELQVVNMLLSAPATGGLIRKSIDGPWKRPHLPPFGRGTTVAMYEWSTESLVVPRARRRRIENEEGTVWWIDRMICVGFKEGGSAA
jgi:hypothetical protein